MDKTSKQQASGDATPDLQQILKDFEALRADLATLVSHVKAGATSTASDAMRGSAERVGLGAKRVYDELAAEGERAAAAIGEKVEQRPLFSLLAAFAVGFCVSRMLR